MADWRYTTVGLKGNADDRSGELYSWYISFQIQKGKSVNVSNEEIQISNLKLACNNASVNTYH